MKQEFSAVIKKHPNINGAYIEPPFDVEKVFGAKRAKVKASFDGVEYRGSIVRMGGCYMLGLTQEIRKRIGKDGGDTIHVTLEKDEEERVLELPEDFRAALESNADALKTYEKLSYTGKREYYLWITEAKREASRQERIVKAVDKLSEGKRLRG